MSEAAISNAKHEESAASDMQLATNGAPKTPAFWGKGAAAKEALKLSFRLPSAKRVASVGSKSFNRIFPSS